MNARAVSRLLKSTTLRLAASYLLIIMVLSIGFSFVFYQTSAHELGRQLPPASFFGNQGGNHVGNGTDYSQYFQERIDEGRGALLAKLVILNICALALGALLSYFLARRTLTPIENAMDSQSRFVTDASHELRTPLTAMLAGNEVALRKPKLTTAEARGVISSNTEEIAKLKDLSDGLLSLAAQDNSKIARQPVSLQDVAGEAMNRVLPAAQAKNISIKDNVPDIKVLGGASSLAQALVILLDNAIKYSPLKTTVSMEGFKKGKHGYLLVNDEGPGINRADLPHIFDRFYRADASRTRSDADGYGIGLSIAKKIIEQHHGKITVSSTPGKGSAFVVEIPLA